MSPPKRARFDAPEGTDGVAGDARSIAKAPVRITRSLLNEAMRAAGAAHRSVPRQLEYWTVLGRQIEAATSATEAA